MKDVGQYNTPKTARWGRLSGLSMSGLGH